MDISTFMHVHADLKNAEKCMKLWETKYITVPWMSLGHSICMGWSSPVDALISRVSYHPKPFTCVVHCPLRVVVLGTCCN